MAGPLGNARLESLFQLPNLRPKVEAYHSAIDERRRLREIVQAGSLPENYRSFTDAFADLGKPLSLMLAETSPQEVLAAAVSPLSKAGHILPAFAGIARPVGIDRSTALNVPKPTGDPIFQHVDPEKMRLGRLEKKQIMKRQKARGIKPRFTFGVGRDGKQLNPIARANRVTKLSDAIYNEFLEINRAAQAGDHNARVMLNHFDWYKRTRDTMEEAFGGKDLPRRFQVEAAFSRNTAPKDQHRNAVEFLRMYENGELDSFLADFRRHLDEGGSVNMRKTGTPISSKNANSYPEERLPKRADGKHFGLNTTFAMKRLVDIEDAGGIIQPRPGDAPKVFRYGTNMSQTGDRPTVDIWIGRQMERLFTGKPVFGKDMAIPGQFKERSTWSKEWQGEGRLAPEITGAYGVASDAIERASMRLGMRPDELQAVMWMKEKFLWQDNGWTSVDKQPDLARIVQAEAKARAAP